MIVLILRVFPQRSNFGSFQQSFIITFDWIKNFQFWWFYRKDPLQIYQSQPYFNLNNYFFIYENPFECKKIYFFIIWLQYISFELLPRYRDFFYNLMNASERYRQDLAEIILPYLKHLFLHLWKGLLMWKHFIHFFNYMQG